MAFTIRLAGGTRLAMVAMEEQSQEAQAQPLYDLGHPLDADLTLNPDGTARLEFTRADGTRARVCCPTLPHAEAILHQRLLARR